MSKRSIYTTITPLPAGVTRATVLETLHLHTEMIDLNPLVEERHPIKAPPKATPEEFHCQWYELTDKIQYLPGGLYSGKISYNACFHDLANGVQTHIYAPMGLEIRGTWTIGGTLPGEPQAPVEMGKGIPMQGLYLREDTDLKCNVFLMSFVKKNLKNSHAALVARMVVKAQLYEAAMANDRMSEMTTMSGQSSSSPHLSYIQYNPSGHGPSPLSSPGFPGSTQPGPSSMYPDPLTLRSQSPFAPGMPGQQHPYPSHLDQRFSTQSTASFASSSQGGVDPAYAAANPYGQHGQQQRGGQQMYPHQYMDHRQSSYPPSELASHGSASEMPGENNQPQKKGGVDPAGPPVHPGPTPVELPAEL